VTIDGKQLRFDAKGVAQAKLTCPADEASPPCAGKLAIKTAKKVEFKGKKRKVALDAAKFELAAGETGKVKLKLSKAELDLLAEVTKARKLKATAKATDAAGNKANASKTLKASVAGG
jgi:hypothetical protein